LENRDKRQKYRKKGSNKHAEVHMKAPYFDTRNMTEESLRRLRVVMPTMAHSSIRGSNC